MPIYAIVQLTIHDRASYQRYQDRFMGVFGKYKGRLLAADEKPQVVEGAWDREKVVLMSFPDEAAFREWAESPDYQEIAKDRKAGSNAVVLLVKGFPGVSSTQINRASG
ncbi:MAG TPA: DUF1330 domain-containing protein [Bryobacteraceae bacterium]|nr:DUF1330 domain-containing protein [Bryobacteraceae bacterium]